MAVGAALQRSTPAFGRRSIVRRCWGCLAAASGPVLGLVLGLIFADLLAIAWTTPASAQGFTFNPIPPRPKPPRVPSDGQMLVQAVEVDYDYNNSRVSAVGNVQMFYNGTSVEADKVIYDQKTKRLHAEGNIRMTDADGKITYANIMDLSDDYRDGFVDSLRVDTADQTRMAATRADRTSGNYTVFENGVYTACAPCRDDPKKPPLWQVKGARIIHDQIDKMLYFENAQLEFFGVPMAYLPYFSTPDPTVKRKSGFLMPSFTETSGYGYGVEVPYYWSIAPDYDMTFNPRFTSQQGVLLQAEFRQRLMDGSYQIRAYGIDQQDPAAFAGAPGDRQFRGGVESKGQFALNDKWVWGWEGVALTDYMMMSGLPAVAVQGPAGRIPEPADRSRFAALSDRRRQPQLLRRAHDLLSQPFRQPVPGAGGRAGDRLFERGQPLGARRRVQLQGQLHQPDPRHRGVRPDHRRGPRQRQLSADLGRSGREHHPGELPAARHAGHLYAGDGRGGLAQIVSPMPPARSGRRSPASAPTPSTLRSPISPASRTSCRPARPRR